MLSLYYRFHIRVFILLIFLVAFTWLLSLHQVKKFQLPNLNSYQCKVKKPVGDEVFSIYIPSNWQAKNYAHSLCNEVLVGLEFSHVKISWQPRENITTSDIVKQNYNVLWFRHSSLNGLMPGYDSFYEVLISMPKNSIYWLTHVDSPSLTQDFFRDKAIGFLTDPKSHSAYQQPLKQLNDYNIEIAQGKIQYYLSRKNLISDFLAKKLDLISIPGSGIIEINNWPTNKKILITDKTSIGDWFINKSASRSLKCKIKMSFSFYREHVEQIIQKTIPESVCVE